MNREKLDFEISHVKRTATPFNMQSKHYHDKYEIYYLLNGKRFYFIDDRSYHVKKGDIVLINKNILHKTNTADKYSHERILILFSSSILNKFISNCSDIDLSHCFNVKQKVFSLDPEEQLWIENHLFNIILENQKKNEGYLTYIKILIVELLIFLNRIAKSTNSFPTTYPDQTHENMSRIASFINDNYNKELSLIQLADKFNYSPTYLSKAFKEVTGFNFVEYKNNVRIKEASKLLHQSNLNVTEIAGQVGYNNLTHFGRIFKQITGYSPLEYRKIRNNLL